MEYISTQRGTDASHKLLENIKAVIAKTVIGTLIINILLNNNIAAQPTLASLNKSLFSSESYKTAAFELLGFDILVDENLKP